MSETKQCDFCRKYKSLDCFSIDKRCNDNRGYKCIACQEKSYRLCKQCDKRLPIDKFGWSSKSRGYRFHICKPCRNKIVQSERGESYRIYMRDYMRNKRAK